MNLLRNGEPRSSDAHASARGRARGAQCRAPRQGPGRCDDGQIPRPRGNPHVKAFVPDGRVPDSPTPTIMLNVKWHDLDRPCCRDGANGSRSALREQFNYAHVIPIFERGDAPGSWRSRRGGWCPTATSRGGAFPSMRYLDPRFYPWPTSDSPNEAGTWHRASGRTVSDRPVPSACRSGASRSLQSPRKVRAVRVAGFLCIAPSDGRSYRAGAVALQ